MRQLTAILTCVFLFSNIGCQDPHSKNKEAALKRWDDQRAQMTYGLALQQLESGEINKAAVTTNNIIAEHPEYAQAHLLLGRIYIEQDKLNRAETTFKHTLTLAPDYPQAHYYLGIIYERWHEPEQAIQHYQKAWELENNNLAYLLALVETKTALGDYQQALNFLLEQVAHTERSSSIYVTAGNILTQQGDYDQAAEMYRKATYINPDNNAINELLAFALHRKGNSGAEAIVLFEDLCELAQSESREIPWVYHLAMGDCYMELQKFHQAQRSFERITNYDDNDPVAWTRLAQAVLARENLDHAQQCALRALSLNPRQTDALMVLGYVAMKQKNYLDGESKFQNIINLEKENVLAYCLLGQCLAAQGKNTDAKACYTQALQIDPNDALAQKLAARNR